MTPLEGKDWLLIIKLYMKNFMKSLIVLFFTLLFFSNCSSTKNSTTTEGITTPSQQATQDKPQMDSSGKFVK